MKFTEEELKALNTLNEDELVEGMLYVNSPEGIEQARKEKEQDEKSKPVQAKGRLEEENIAVFAGLNGLLAKAILPNLGTDGKQSDGLENGLRFVHSVEEDMTDVRHFKTASSLTFEGTFEEIPKNSESFTVTSSGTGGVAAVVISPSLYTKMLEALEDVEDIAAFDEALAEEGDVEEVDEPYVDEDDAKEAEFTRVFNLGYNQGLLHGESNAESEYEELTNQAVDDAEKMYYRLGDVDGYQRGKDETILNMQNNVVEAFTIGQNSEFGEGDGSHEVYDRGYTDGIKDARAENIVEYQKGITVGFNDGKDYIIHGGWWDGYEFHPDPDPRYEATVDIKVKEKLESLALKAIDAHERGVKEGEARGREKGFAEGVDYIVHTGEHFEHSALYDQGKKDGRAEGADYWYKEGFIQGRQGYIQALVDDNAEEAF